MKVVIFAGGLGTRLSEETENRPKPMVEIGDQPILWHIMKIFSHYGLNDFVICGGYKRSHIHDYFANFLQRGSDVTFHIDNDEMKMTVHRPPRERWNVTLVDTGLRTMTAGRLAMVKDYVGEDDFCLTYGDGLADVDLRALIAFHKKHKKAATVTAIQPSGRFGALDIKGDAVTEFVEKPVGDRNWINGGFFVLKPEVFNFLPENPAPEMWEGSPMRNLAEAGQLQAYKHRGFWHAMDTLRDKKYLDDLYEQDNAPWVVWDDGRI
ncbi:MAG: glucose-1-phosphate cytidylyltransferase [Paracoccaceae bacterium]